MGKNSKLLTIVLVLSILGNIVLGYGLYRESKDHQAVKIAVENNYQRDFLKLNDNVEQIKLQLAQSLVSASDEQLLLGVSNLWRAVYGAINSLNALPLNAEELAETGSFLRDTAEYSYYLLRQIIISSEGMSDGQWDKLEEFYKRAQAVQSELDKIQAQALKENWRFSEIDLAEDNTIAAAFRGIEEKVAAFPLLELEEGVRKIEPELQPIEGVQISAEEALETAAEFGNTFFDGDYEAKLEYTADSSEISTYGARLEGKNTEPIYIEISQKGGHILQMYRYQTQGRERLSTAEAEDAAESFLEKMGFRNLAKVDALKYDDSLDLTYVPCQDGVYLYADMLKVMVSLENGEILSFDQSSYITHHYKREIKPPKLSKEEVVRKMNPHFQISELRLALIGDDYTRGEFLTYEVRGVINDEEFAVFVDADTARERRIVKLEQNEEYEFPVEER